MDENETRAGIVKVSLPMLQSLFGDQCRVERVGITDDDFRDNTISLVVSGNPSLPVIRQGQRTPNVRCVFTRHEGGGLSIAFDQQAD